MKKFHFKVSLLIASLWLSLISGVLAAGNAPDEPLVMTSGDGRFELYSDTNLDPKEAHAFLLTVQNAWNWLLETQQWVNPTLLDGQPVQLRLLDDDNAPSGGSGRGFTIALKRLYTLPDLTKGTVAHELNHVQDRRQTGNGVVPGFITEGRGLTNGFWYRYSLGLPPQPYDHALARSIANFTPEQMSDVVHRMQRGDVHDANDPKANARLEFGGAWFVEYLRTTFNGHGFPDVQPRLASVISEVHNGIPFEDAFKKVFGVEFSRVQDAFIAFVTNTEGTHRVKSMIWEGLIGKENRN
ncbi:hypothetical protein [Methylomonas sp. AM2-LC]|uniref:hypothetical protein n=1 Tax=Methylomonas sp. AM2-LC TaxID=3153301 RepID=UPI00326569E1